MGLIVSLVAGAVAAGCAVLPAIGFTAEGIAAGSIAAGIQSGIGNVVAGSAFATLQSAGMSGALNAIGAAAGTVSMAAGAVGLAELPEPAKSFEDDEEDAQEEVQDSASSVSFGSLDNFGSGEGMSKMKVKSSVAYLLIDRGKLTNMADKLLKFTRSNMSYYRLTAGDEGTRSKSVVKMSKFCKDHK